MKINFSNKHYVVLKKDAVLNRRLNMDLFNFFKYYATGSNLKEEEKKLKEKIYDIWEQVSVENKNLLQLLYYTNFENIYVLKNKYQFTFVEYNCPNQIKDIMAVLSLMRGDEASWLSDNGVLGLSFISSGPNTVYYQNGFGVDYLDMLKSYEKDYLLEKQLKSNISELITCSYVINNADIDEKQDLLADINRSLDISLKNATQLTIPVKGGKAINKKITKDVTKDLGINYKVQEKVLIQLSISKKEEVSLNYENIEKTRQDVYGKRKLSRLH